MMDEGVRLQVERIIDERTGGVNELRSGVARDLLDLLGPAYPEETDHRIQARTYLEQVQSEAS